MTGFWSQRKETIAVIATVVASIMATACSTVAPAVEDCRSYDRSFPAEMAALGRQASAYSTYANYWFTGGCDPDDPVVVFDFTENAQKTLRALTSDSRVDARTVRHSLDDIKVGHDFLLAHFDDRPDAGNVGWAFEPRYQSLLVDGIILTGTSHGQNFICDRLPILVPGTEIPIHDVRPCTEDRRQLAKGKRASEKKVRVAMRDIRHLMEDPEVPSVGLAILSDFRRLTLRFPDDASRDRFVTMAPDFMQQHPFVAVSVG